jgi:hypothetical protein
MCIFTFFIQILSSPGFWGSTQKCFRFFVSLLRVCIRIRAVLLVGTSNGSYHKYGVQEICLVACILMHSPDEEKFESSWLLGEGELSYLYRPSWAGSWNLLLLRGPGDLWMTDPLSTSTFGSRNVSVFLLKERIASTRPLLLKKYIPGYVFVFLVVKLRDGKSWQALMDESKWETEQIRLVPWTVLGWQFTKLCSFGKS